MNDVNLEGSRNPEVVRLNQAIQDLDMQIEEQKMKIETTVNPVLRVRNIFCFRSCDITINLGKI